MRVGTAVLIAMVVVSSLAVVFVRHQHRITFLELQRSETQRDNLNIEWEQLLLEQSTWSFQSVVEKKAREQLNMIHPEPDEIVVVDGS